MSDILELHYVESRKFRKSKPHSLQNPFRALALFLKFADLYSDETLPLPDNLAQEEGIPMSLEECAAPIHSRTDRGPRKGGAR
ncbi:MAG: hypothetical protein KIS61_05245 [Candidatus Eremiobacteraeota bacterium]|nr:hypothetical protein [Candidatus Eremiobacteraeota bacterium]